MELRCWGFFLVRLAFTQLRHVGGKGFLIHRNTAAQPSLLPWVGISDYLSLPFMLLTVMNLFSWNGQNLGPQMGSKCPWLHCRDSFYGKEPPSWQGLQHIGHKYMILSCIRHIHALYLWFWGDVEGGDKPFLWRAHGFPFFPCTEWRDPEHRGGRLPPWWECTKAHAYCREDGWGMCWVSACSV